MMMSKNQEMTIEYAEGIIKASRLEEGHDDIHVTSDNRKTLEAVVDSIELAGVAEGKDFDDLYIYRAEHSGKSFYELILDEGTFILWFSFEILNYM